MLGCSGTSSSSSNAHRSMQVIIRMNSLLSGFDVESPGTQHGVIPRGIELTIATRTEASSVSLHFRVLHPVVSAVGTPCFLPGFCVKRSPAWVCVSGEGAPG